MVAVAEFHKSAVQPDPGSLHVNRPLTNMSLAFDPIREGYVADRAFPVIDVQNQTDSYWTFDQSYWLRDEVRQRAPLTESAGGGYEQGLATYLAKRHSVHKDVPDEERANTDTMDADSGAQAWVTEQLYLHKEITWAAAAMVTGVWSADIVGVASGPTGTQVLRWDVAGSNPIGNIAAQSTAMQTSTGRRGKKLIMGRPVWDAIKQHASIIDLIKYGQTPGSAAQVTKEAVAGLFEVDEILIMEAVVNTAKEGATAAYSFVGGKNALLVNTPERPGLRTASAGYTFNWKGLTGVAANAIRIKKFRMEHLSADRVEGDMAYDQKVIAPSLGVFFSNIVS